MDGVITSMAMPAGERPVQPATDVAPEQVSFTAADVWGREITGRVARGDENAFPELYDNYRDRVFRLALVVGSGDQALAHEIVQSVFLTAASKLPRVESEAHLWNWLARVARQQIGKVWRQKRRDSSIASMTDLPEHFAVEQSASELEERLDTALLSMDAEENQLIDWFYFDKFSHKEIAAQLRLTPKAVSSRLERARAKLRVLLERQNRHDA